MKLVDLSHTVEDGMITYRGLPAPVICDFLSREASRKVYAEGTEFHIGRIDMVANTGTYIDSPFHRFADGKDLSELPLTSVADLEGMHSRVDRESPIGIVEDRAHSKPMWPKHQVGAHFFAIGDDNRFIFAARLN